MFNSAVLALLLASWPSLAAQPSAPPKKQTRRPQVAATGLTLAPVGIQTKFKDSADSPSDFDLFTIQQVIIPVSCKAETYQEAVRTWFTTSKAREALDTMGLALMSSDEVAYCMKKFRKFPNLGMMDYDGQIGVILLRPKSSEAFAELTSKIGFLSTREEGKATGTLLMLAITLKPTDYHYDAGISSFDLRVNVHPYGVRSVGTSLEVGIFEEYTRDSRPLVALIKTALSKGTQP